MNLDVVGVPLGSISTNSDTVPWYLAERAWSVYSGSVGPVEDPWSCHISAGSVYAPLVALTGRRIVALCSQQPSTKSTSAPPEVVPITHNRHIVSHPDPTAAA